MVKFQKLKLWRKTTFWHWNLRELVEKAYLPISILRSLQLMVSDFIKTGDRLKFWLKMKFSLWWTISLPVSHSLSLSLINKPRHIWNTRNLAVTEQEKKAYKSERERRKRKRDEEIKFPISPVTDIIRNTLCLLTDWHQASLDAAADTGKMLCVNLWQPKCGCVFEAGTFPLALLILILLGNLFSIQGNGTGVMYSCKIKNMLPLWPPVCK